MIKSKDAIKELTMMLMYLNRFNDNKYFPDEDMFYAWKGYDFDIINQLDDEQLISQGKRPSRSKSVYITQEGVVYAKELLKKYGIED